MSGSASASRLVARSNCARLLRSSGDVRVVLAEALLINLQRPAHERFRLRQPVGVLKQLRQIVEVSGDVRVVLAEALLINHERAAHERFCLRQPVGGLKQLSQIVEVSGNVRVVLAEALLINLQRPAHERLRLRQPVGGQKQLRQIVEISGDVLGFSPKLCSSILRARRMSGSASAWSAASKRNVAN